MQTRPGETLCLLLGLGIGAGLMFAPSERVEEGRRIGKQILQRGQHYFATAEAEAKRLWVRLGENTPREDKPSGAESSELKLLDWKAPRAKEKREAVPPLVIPELETRPRDGTPLPFPNAEN